MDNRIHVYNLSDLVFKIMNIKKLFLQDVRNGTWKGIYLIMMSLKESFKSFKSSMFFLIGSRTGAPNESLSQMLQNAVFGCTIELSVQAF